MATGGIIHAFHFATHRPEPIRQASLLMVLAAGVSQGSDVINMLRSYGSESKPPWSGKVLHLAALLEQGGTLADSVSVVDDLLPEESVIAIRVAEQCGNLESILADEAVRLARLSQQQGSTSTLAAMFLCSATLGIAWFIVMFLMYFIVPKYKDIFEGFDMEMTPLSQSLFGIWDNVNGIVVLFGLPVVALVVLSVIIVWKSHRGLLTSGWSYAHDWRPRWRTPMILRQLSLAAMTRQPLDNALHAVLRVMRPGRTATQLSAVRQAVAGGTDWSEALRSSGFVNRREMQFLESATRTHHEDWAMRHLAKSMERRHLEWTRRVTSFFWPSLIIITGLVVGYIVLAFYMPLVDMMQHILLDSDRPLTFS